MDIIDHITKSKPKFLCLLICDIYHVLNASVLNHFSATSSGSTAGASGGNELQWYFSQVKGTMDEDVAERNIALL